MHTNRPDLVLLDFSLPNVDGLELCRQIRAEPRWNAVPIIALTARGHVDDRVTGLREGLNDYLTKPFCISELAAGIDANLGRSRRELQCGGRPGGQPLPAHWRGQPRRLRDQVAPQGQGGTSNLIERRRG